MHGSERRKRSQDIVSRVNRKKERCGFSVIYTAQLRSETTLCSIKAASRREWKAPETSKLQKPLRGSVGSVPTRFLFGAFDRKL